ncbi:MAG: hypothetical protein A3F33_01795 [Candidatus Woykebacteria bacterium RIFCSPHIGHO2_12_FULL_43_10]|uniref:Uncharacterized protein n=1 Tax=Candidatus Woykebacteria bacterium RIFCSPHIGHO2_02_FULL_43_16b TaxID=1802601 RepID=A0A1G1WMF6_9BACT|nr:MAG: hypothetical protein A3J50_03750 [Candidatus Woykebacteria bacterium RIFCSPHIGHO2_02_FULL_43_16b]OGY29905.1 MAG: hypothetical protein A3F33_01795 [Candidatus Woykebacteria bacterium RIFCSPHIGHO2_12_FULL_43_10]
MITQTIRKQYSKQLNYFQSQIPLGVQRDIIPTSTVEHYHQLIGELEEKCAEDLSRFKIPESVRLNEERYYTDGVRDRLGSLIGYLDSEIDEAKEEGSADTLKIITGVQRTIRKFFRTKPSSEKDVQEKLEDLFNAQELTFRREQEHIPYSSKTYIPDFTFDDINCVVEVKFCDSTKREKEMIAEINDDIQPYSTRYKNLIFVIYDMGFIRDEEKFKEDIESKSVVIEIIKH